MKKDFRTTVTLNSQIKELMDKKGITVQMIINEWIEKNIEVQEKPRMKKVV